MGFMVSQLIEEVTAHAQNDSLEDAREICAEGTYFPNNLRKRQYYIPVYTSVFLKMNPLFRNKQKMS